MDKKSEILQVISSEFNSVVDRNKNYEMNNHVHRYFSRMSEGAYHKHHISMDKEIIYNAVFKSTILNKYLRKSKITIVDVGAGCCDLEEKLLDVLSLDQDVSMVALDMSSNMLKNSKIVPKKYPFSIQFISADAISAGVKSDCSDITFIINVLPYIDDVRSLLSELYRITRTNGIIVIVKPVKDRFNFWERYFDDIKIYFHENFENIIDLERFQIVENSPIELNPIQDVEIIKVQIGKLMIIKVLK